MTEAEFKKEFYEKASKVKTKDDLDSFLNEITSYSHDYGTIVYGCMSAMKAAFNYVNRCDQGGITGFQAGCIMWECIREFGMFGENSRLRILNNADLLYPQMEYKFRRSIDSETWRFLQKEAKANLEKTKNASPNVIRHWESIAAGKTPFGFEVIDDQN